jgi:hypothetical protein
MVLVPSPEEVEELSEIFTPLLDKIISNNKRLKNLASLRDSLLLNAVNIGIKLRPSAIFLDNRF